MHAVSYKATLCVITDKCADLGTEGRGVEEDGINCTVFGDFMVIKEHFERLIISCVCVNPLWLAPELLSPAHDEVSVVVCHHQHSWYPVAQAAVAVF